MDKKLLYIQAMESHSLLNRNELSSLYLKKKKERKKDIWTDILPKKI